jgi:16S rRNA (guanine966-N2)-methyltransferase
MLRQAVFSSLGETVTGAKCLDLFAGTGAYGLEALSRGASGVRFVESDKRGVSSIEANVAAVCKSMKGDPRSCVVDRRDVFTWSCPGEKYDIVFADPPYAMLPANAAQIFDIVLPVLAEDGIFIFEMPAEIELRNNRMSMYKRLGKGRNDPSACFYRAV